jgi:hypothetical protein
MFKRGDKVRVHTGIFAGESGLVGTSQMHDGREIVLIYFDGYWDDGTRYSHDMESTWMRATNLEMA